MYAEIKFELFETYYFYVTVDAVSGLTFFYLTWAS